MNAVRYYLSISVLIAHFNLVMNTNIFWPSDSFSAVGGFFALSGFLVFGSCVKAIDKGGFWSGLKSYVAGRARRILPSYFFIVLLCAFTLVAVSECGALEYFTSSRWWRYLAANLCFLNFLQPDLPGVFSGWAVNGSLWTMKIEWLLYFSAPLVLWLSAKFARRERAVLWLFLLIILLSGVWRLVFLNLYYSTGSEACNILSRQVFGQLSFFYAGAGLRLILPLFMRHKHLWALAALAVLLLSQLWLPVDVLLMPLALAVIVIWLSFTGSWGLWLSQRANISYDVYLFHMPVILLVWHFGLQGPDAFVAVIAATFLLSVLSYRLVERRFLKR